MAALARWCFHHRTVVVLAWVAVLVTLVAVERSVGDAYSTSFTLANTESSKALELVTAALPKQAGDSATIVFHTADGTVNDPATKARIEKLLGTVAAAQSVAAVRSPYGPRAPPRSAATARPPSLRSTSRSSPRNCRPKTSSGS